MEFTIAIQLSGSPAFLQYSDINRESIGL